MIKIRSVRGPRQKKFLPLNLQNRGTKVVRRSEKLFYAIFYLFLNNFSYQKLFIKIKLIYLLKL
jgi:hypothetical protein